jgi:hypothetical protein
MTQQLLWVKQLGDTMYMDGYLKQNLDMCKEVIKQDWDFLFVVDGVEQPDLETIDSLSLLSACICF